MLLVWLLWFGHDPDLGTGPDSSPAQTETGHVDAQTKDADDRREAPTQAEDKDKGEPSSENARQLVQTTPPPSMRIRVLYKADRTPVAGAAVTARSTQRMIELRKRAGKKPDKGTLAAIRRAASTEAITDTDGIAVIPRQGERYLVEATHRDMWGRLYVGPKSKKPFEILLQKDHTLRVRVRSEATSQPVPGVLVGLRRFNLYGMAFEATFERTASPDGVATFQHVQQVLNVEGRWQVFLGVPVRKQSFAPISKAKLPTEPVELVLPDTGSVIVKVHDENRVAVDGRGLRCKLSVYPTASRVKPVATASYWSRRPIDKDGVAKLTPIGVGLFLRIDIRASDYNSRHKPVTVDLPGPTRAGETVTCDVLWGSANDPEAYYPLVSGRLVHQDGSPWSSVKIRVQPRIFPTPRSYPSSREVRLTKDGRFKIVLKEPCPAGGKRILRLRTEAKSEFGALEARLDLSRNFPPGETDIGDVVLDRGQLLVAGRVVDAGDRPLPKARVHVTQLVITDKGKEYWPRVDCVGGYAIAKDGSFALHAIPGMELPTGRLRLQARCPGLLPVEPQEFLMGTKGLRIVLQSGGGLAGSIRLAEGQSPSDVMVLVRADGTAYGVSVKKDGSFRRQGLRPGAVTVEAVLRAGSPEQRRASKVEIKDVLIRSGETNEDPRLQGIALGSSLPGAEIEVFGEGGEPISRAIIRPLSKRANTEYADHKGHLTLHAEKFPVAVMVSGFGYAEKKASLKVGKNKVVLSRGLTIELHTKVPTIGKDPDYHLCFMIYHVETKSGAATRHVYDHTFPYDRRYFDAAGKASIPVPGPGTYEIQPLVYVSGKDNIGRGGSLPMKSFPRIQVVAGKPSQRFEIHIPAGVLADTVRKHAK